MKYMTSVKGESYIIEIDNDEEVMVNGEVYPIDFQSLSTGGLVSLLIKNRSLEAAVEEQDDGWDVLIRGELYAVKVLDERAHRLAQARGQETADSGEASLISPMPGLIVSVIVAEGEQVAKGDKLIILESMKMENELRAPREGMVSRISVAAGDSVEKGQVLVLIGEA